MPTTERAILTIILKIALVFFLLNLLQQLPEIITIIVLTSSNIQAWTGQPTPPAVQWVYYIVYLVSYLALIGFGLYAWFKPGVILGPLKAGEVEPEKKEIDAEILFQGALTLIGVYFVVTALADLIQMITFLYELFTHPDDKLRWSSASRNFLTIASQLFVFGAGVLLIFSRRAIARVIMNARGLSKPQGKDMHSE